MAANNIVYVVVEGFSGRVVGAFSTPSRAEAARQYMEREGINCHITECTINKNLSEDEDSGT